MVETLTESFCERCGTRYEFKAPTRLNPLRKTRGLVGGLKNYLTSQDALSDAIGDAMRTEEDQLASAQLEAFHESFNFCIGCRQYTCLNCWNDGEGRCRSCAPIPGTDDLAERLAASLNGAGASAVADTPLAGSAADLADSDLQRRLGLEAWPSTDTRPTLPPPATGSAEAWPGADALTRWGEGTPAGDAPEDAPWRSPFADTDRVAVDSVAEDRDPAPRPDLAAASAEAALDEPEQVAAADEGDREPVAAWSESEFLIPASERELTASEGEVQPLQTSHEAAPEGVDQEPVAAELEPEPVTAELEPLAGEIEFEPIGAEAGREPVPAEPVVAEFETEPEPVWPEAILVEPEATAPEPPPRILRVVAWEEDVAADALVMAEGERDPIAPEAVAEPVAFEAPVDVEPVAAEADPAVAAGDPLAAGADAPAAAVAAAEELIAEAESVEAELQPEPLEAEAMASESEPVEAEADPEPVVSGAEPEPIAAAADAGVEREPIATEAAQPPTPAFTEATFDAEPDRPAPARVAPIRETILHFPERAPSQPESTPIAAEDESPEVAARRAQLDMLGLGDPGEGPVAPQRPVIMPYRSRGAAAGAGEIAARAGGSFWEASAREVAGAAANIGVQNCGQCGLSLSANARFCRRCGTRQARSA